MIGGNITIVNDTDINIHVLRKTRMRTLKERNVEEKRNLDQIPIGPDT